MADNLPTSTDEKEVKPEVKKEKVFDEVSAKLWKRRYETSCDWWNKSDHKDECERIVKYLHNNFSGTKDSEEVFLNQFFISLKTLVPLVIAHNPFVPVSAENDVVYEYDEQGQVRKDEQGQPIKHDMTKTAASIQALLKKRLKKVVNLKAELRTFLRNAIAFNRGIFLVGHTINAEYKGSFNKPFFHAYLKSVSPRKIKRQAGTTRIDEGTYCFYEYELPVSHLKKNSSYDQELLKQCTQEILENVKIDDEDSDKESLSGLYDDVKYIKLHNAYDFLAGEIFVFGKGCDTPLKTMQTSYSFKNPFAEFIPNETFQPDQTEPISDLMMVENIVKKAQKIIKKAIRHIESFNTGYNVEKSAIDKEGRKRIEKSKDRAFWVFNDNALSGSKVQPRMDVPMGQEAFNLIQFLYDFVDKTLAVYNFQQGGNAGQDETATKTRARVGTSQVKSGDMSDVFTDSVNEGLDKYLEVLIQTTDTREVVEVVGDAGEVEYRPFNGDEAKRGQYYAEIDIQSMGKENVDVRIQQALKFYEILKSDPDPLVQQKFDKIKLVEKIAKNLKLGEEGIIKKTPDTQGMDEQAYRDFIKQQILKAKKETQQAVAGAEPLPPSPDDDDDVHLADHLGKAQELKTAAASLPDPMAQQQEQVKIDRIVSHSRLHIDRKTEKEAIESKFNPKPPAPQMPQGAPRQKVANNPPMPGQIAGQAQRKGM